MRGDAERVAYFGKLPSRSDFVKAADDLALIGALDGWLAQAMSALAGDARWKINYDAMPPLSFAFVGRRRSHAIVGHLMASADQSGRRFPFMLMRKLKVAAPATFIARSTLLVAPIWQALASAGAVIMAAADPTEAMRAARALPLTLCDDQGASQRAWLAQETLASLGAMLGEGAPRPMMLALGLLLTPVARDPACELGNSLVLPLPGDLARQMHVAAFWLGLIAPFLAQSDIELALFLLRRPARTVLVVGFRGASAQTLQSIIDPLLARSTQIDLQDSAWVDHLGEGEIDVRALSCYLDQADLPLAMAADLFLQTFLGVAREP